jgi:hypothetical protein
VVVVKRAAVARDHLLGMLGSHVAGLYHRREG